MKESMSYSFLLNIIILFIFVCASVVMGIFSYYKAFRANTIVVNEIEKFEGYNCFARESISKKLNTISYNLPFSANCNNKGSDKNPCVVSPDGNYAVVSYNIDFNGTTADVEYVGHTNTMDAKIDSKGNYTKTYQYGVYTYMYTDLPIVSKILRIPVFTKTNILHEFRDLRYTTFDGKISIYDADLIPDEYFNDENGLTPNRAFSLTLQAVFNEMVAEHDALKTIKLYYGQSSRNYARYAFRDPFYQAFVLNGVISIYSNNECSDWAYVDYSNF